MVRAEARISERRACGLLLVVRGTCRYVSVTGDRNDELRQKLRELAMVARCQPELVAGLRQRCAGPRGRRFLAPWRH